MSDLDASTPRVFLARHGETEWTKSVQHTGRSDIPLTTLGERQVSSTGSLLVGPAKLLDPRQVKKVWVSPRKRALRTFELLFNTTADADGNRKIFGGGSGSVVVTEQIREWDYGDYEGIRPGDVKKMRKEQGLDREGEEWSVWRDGCPGGESKEGVEGRLDELIQEIQDLQKPYMNEGGVANVVLVAHGLIGRCFIKRWLKMAIDAELPMMLPPGALSILSYKDHNVEKPAFFVGMAIPAIEHTVVPGLLRRTCGLSFAKRSTPLLRQVTMTTPTAAARPVLHRRVRRLWKEGKTQCHTGSESGGSSTSER